jgi:hypothetical protein
VEPDDMSVLSMPTTSPDAKYPWLVPDGPCDPVLPFGPCTFQASGVSFDLQLALLESMTRNEPSLA